jgi:hypothetical protein
MLNPINSRQRYSLALIAIFALLLAVWFPSQLAWDFGAKELAVPISAGLFVAVLFCCLILARVIRALPGLEVLPLVLTISIFWISLFGVDGAFEVLPGNWRRIWFAGWVSWDPVPYVFLGTSIVFAVLTLLSPPTRENGELAARSWFIRSASRFSGRRTLGFLILVVVALAVLDSWTVASRVASVNACVEERFQNEWRSAYLADPFKVHEKWRKPTGITPPGWESYWAGGEWEVTPAVPFRGPDAWSDFINVVGETGIKVTIVEDLETNQSRVGTLGPWSLKEGGFGFNFNSFVEKLSNECVALEGPPLFPVDEWGHLEEESLIDGISEISGYVEPPATAAP